VPGARGRRCPLGLAADVVTTPLPLSRPPWGAVLATGLAGHSAALILVLHHVLADGIGGLAVLASLADGDPAGPGGPGDRGAPEVPAKAPDGFPAPAPSRRSLAADAWAGRLRALRDLPGAMSTVRAARCSLNPGHGRRRERDRLVRRAVLCGHAGGHRGGGSGPPP